MKRIVLSAVLSVLLLTGCGTKQPDSRADHIPPESSNTIGEADISAAEDSTEGDQISADSTQQTPQQVIYLDTEHESYPAGAKEITVRIINASASDFVFTNADFGIEHFSDGAVSMTPYAQDSASAQTGMTLVSEDCVMWKDSETGAFQKLFFEEGSLAGAELIGDLSQALVLKKALDQGMGKEQALGAFMAGKNNGGEEV